MARIIIILFLFISNVSFSQVHFKSVKQTMLEMNSRTQKFEPLDVYFREESIETDYETLFKWVDSKNKPTYFQIIESKSFPLENNLLVNRIFKCNKDLLIRVLVYKEGQDSIEFQFNKDGLIYKYILYGYWQ